MWRLSKLSEFARSLQNQGDGTHHAWGNMQLVMAGAVSGERISSNDPSRPCNGPQLIKCGALTLPILAH
jgi:uncharacterized protein (DUF1501 family)